VAAAKCWRWRGRWERGGPVFGASRFQGMGSCPELTGIGSGRERRRDGKQREGQGHWLQTPWRRRVASQLLAKHILSRSHPGPAGA